MDLFTKSFFRFAFGFIAVILVSVVIIAGASSMSDRQHEEAACPVQCEGNATSTTR